MNGFQTLWRRMSAHESASTIGKKTRELDGGEDHAGRRARYARPRRGRNLATGIGRAAHALVAGLMRSGTAANMARPRLQADGPAVYTAGHMGLPPLQNRPCGGRYGDIVQAIGNTPLVELKRLSPKPGVRIWAKMESMNPTGSVKDRVARSLIENAEEHGPDQARPHDPRADVGQHRHQPRDDLPPQGLSAEGRHARQRDARSAPSCWRCTARRSSTAPATRAPTAPSRWPTRSPQDTDTYYMPYQYGNEANPLAHYNGTALEILEELDEIAAFVAGLGTGGTLMGNGRRFKEEFGDACKIVAAEPMQGEPVQGLRSLDDGFIPPIIDLSLLDRKIFVTNPDAIIWTRKLLDEEGIFAGVSSGAIARVAVRIANEIDEGNVVFIVCDDGWKYLSSGIYTKPVEEIENLDSTVWW